MNLRGWNGRNVRPPLIDLDQVQRTELEGILRPLLQAAWDMQDTGKDARDASGQGPGAIKLAQTA
jgi:hypothetical protein